MNLLHLSLFRENIKYLYPTFFIIGSFLLSTASSFIVCVCSNQPFCNPCIINDKTQTLTYLRKQAQITGRFLLTNIIGYNIIIFSPLGLSFSVEHYSIGYRVGSLIYTILLIEFLEYWYHRFLHCMKVYKHIHAKHHINCNVYPVDAFNGDFSDNCSLVVLLNTSFYLMPLDIRDYVFLYVAYSMGIILVHSNLLTTHHSNHHKYFHCNYGLLLPFWDIAFDTYRE